MSYKLVEYNTIRNL